MFTTRQPEAPARASSFRPRPVRSPGLITAILAFCGLIVSVMQTIIAPLLHELPALTHSTTSTVSWMVTATLLSGCVLTPVLGRVGDMYGKRRVLMIAMLILVAGSVICGSTSQIGLLIVGRTLQGAALAVIPLGISILRDELPPERIAGSVALMSTTLGIGGAIGLPIAAVLVEYTDWHTMFWVSAGLGLLDIVLVWLFVPESPNRAGGRIDFVGALGLGAVLVLLLVAVEKGHGWGWTSGRTLGCLAASAAIGLIWGAFELRTRDPMVDLRVSARRAVLLTNFAALAVGFSFMASNLATAQMVQEPTSTGYGLGLSIVASGLIALPGGLAMAAFSPISARISNTRGPKVTVAIACVVMAGAYGFRMAFTTQIWEIVLGTLLVSVGTALAYSALPMLIMRAVPASETGAATGLNTLMRTVGQSFSSAMIAAVLTSVTLTVAGEQYPSLRAYITIWAISGCGAIVALAVTLFIPSARARAAHVV